MCIVCSPKSGDEQRTSDAAPLCKHCTSFFPAHLCVSSLQCRCHGCSMGRRSISSCGAHNCVRIDRQSAFGVCLPFFGAHLITFGYVYEILLLDPFFEAVVLWKLTQFADIDSHKIYNMNAMNNNTAYRFSAYMRNAMADGVSEYNAQNMDGKCNYLRQRMVYHLWCLPLDKACSTHPS